MIMETDKKITAGAWRKELESLQEAYEKSTSPYAEVVTDLACVEVLQHNRKDLDRMLENESHKRLAHKEKISQFKRGIFMGEELNIVTSEGVETLTPSFYENIGNMRYNVVLHFASNGSQTVLDRLKRVILHEANSKNGTTNH